MEGVTSCVVVPNANKVSAAIAPSGQTTGRAS